MATNEERSSATRARLLDAAQALFAAHGYAGAATDAILARADVRRGAMYHHYADKAALFEAVCVRLAGEALAAIDAATAATEDPLDALITGSIAWVEFTTRPDVRQILILDAPTVLGWTRWSALDEQRAFRALREGVAHALRAGRLRYTGDAALLAVMANGALNALALEAGAPGSRLTRRAWTGAIRRFWTALAT